MPLVRINSAYLLVENGGPLSETSSRGNPNLAKVSLRTLMTAKAVVVGNVSIHLLDASMRTKKVFP